MKIITDFTPQEIHDNWTMTQVIGNQSWREVDADPPLRQITDDEWRAPRSAFRLRSRYQETLVVMRRQIETVPGARVTLSVSACVQTADSDNPPRQHNIAVNNRLVVALDPQGNDDLRVAGVLADDVPISYAWEEYVLGADASGRRMMLYVGFWFGKDGQYPVAAMNGWLRQVRLEIETPDVDPGGDETPPISGLAPWPGWSIESFENAGEFWRVVMRLPKAPSV